MPKLTVSIRGMHCRSCELLLEDDLGKLPGVSRVEADFRKGQAALWYTGLTPNERAIIEILERAGYHLGQSAARVPWFSRDPAEYTRIIFAFTAAVLVFLVLRSIGWTGMATFGTIDATQLSLVLLIGLTAGISTCAALVGGLVLALSARYSALHPELSWRQKLIPHGWFHLGRVGGFFILGSGLGYLGDWLSGSIGFTALLTLGAGVVMLFLGLQLSNLLPRLSGWSIALPKGVARFLGAAQSGTHPYTHRGALVGGALTFFLPCGFTQAVQLAVVALGQPFLGGVVMATFAMGTIPGLLALGALATALTTQARLWLYPVIAVVLIAFGGWNLSNGLQLLGVQPTLRSEPATGSLELAPLENGIQVIRLTQDERGYHPAELPTLRSGVPARLIIDSQNSYTCAASLVIPEYGIKRQLEPGENIIDFTPTESGRLPFSCSMGMFRGTLTVE